MVACMPWKSYTQVIHPSDFLTETKPAASAIGACSSATRGVMASCKQTFLQGVQKMQIRLCKARLHCLLLDVTLEGPLLVPLCRRMAKRRRPSDYPQVLLLPGWCSYTRGCMGGNGEALTCNKAPKDTATQASKAHCAVWLALSSIWQEV
jgi:hypothetical protein